MYINKNEQLIILNIDLILITKFNILNCDDMKKKTNN